MKQLIAIFFFATFFITESGAQHVYRKPACDAPIRCDSTFEISNFSRMTRKDVVRLIEFETALDDCEMKMRSIFLQSRELEEKQYSLFDEIERFRKAFDSLARQAAAEGRISESMKNAFNSLQAAERQLEILEKNEASLRIQSQRIHAHYAAESSQATLLLLSLASNEELTTLNSLCNDAVLTSEGRFIFSMHFYQRSRNFSVMHN